MAKALKTAERTIKGVDTVIEGHGYVNTWKGYVTYTNFINALVDDSRAAIAKNEGPDTVVAKLQAIPEFAPLLGDKLYEGLEYGGTPISRARIDTNVAFQELRGEKVTTNWGAPLPADSGHGAEKATPVVTPGA